MNELTPSPTDVKEGAVKLVSTCLGMKRDDELVIIADETADAVADAIAQAAMTLGVSATIVKVSTSQQVAFKRGGRLPPPVAAAIKDARALVTCVTDSAECMDFRIAVLRTGQDRGRKIGHMPGAALDLLGTAVNVDYEDITSKCDMLARALAMGQAATLLSWDDDGNQHELQMDLGGWSRMPVPSTGVIPDGAWGNIPSGETYIAPVEGQTRGELHINGSLRRCPLDGRKGLLLSFANGILESYAPEDSPGYEAVEGERRIADGRADPNWRNLAELGVGVNPRVASLTGKLILDEKKLGTAHVAIGSSEEHGGRVSSSIHSDMIVQSPTLLVDGKLIVERGKLVMRMTEWLEDVETAAVPVGWTDRHKSVSRTGILAETRDRHLCRQWHTGGTGILRTYLMQVGDDRTAQLCHAVYAKIPVLGKAISIDQLAKNCGMERGRLDRVLWVLGQYELAVLG